MPEQRIVLRNCGVIDPKDISTYLNQDGFKALEKALAELTPEQVIEEIKKAGLLGRGGRGGDGASGVSGHPSGVPGVFQA